MAKFIQYVKFIPGSRTGGRNPVNPSKLYRTTSCCRSDCMASGPFLDGTGALFIYELATPEEVEKITKNDPYALAGVIASSEIRPWKIVAANAELLTPS